jgi:hypothetical protein
MVSGVAGMSACSLLVGTDELVNGGADLQADVGVDAPTKDVATDVVDGSHQDSPADAKLDVPVDNVVEDVDAGAYCESLSPAPTICSDFDVQNLPAGWDALSGFGGFQGVIDELNFTSPLRSILFTTPVLDSGDSGSRALLSNLGTPTKSISIEFDLLPEVLNSSLTWLITLEMESSAGLAIARFRAWKNGFDVNESAVPSDGGPNDYSGHAITGTPTTGVWQHVKWELDFSGANAFSNVDLDGTISGGGSLLKGYLADATLKLGLTFAETPSVAQRIRYDNIVVRVE